jgi:hypothetical protein
MKLKMLSLVSLLSAAVLVTACGGGMAEEHTEEAMPEAEPVVEEAPAPTQSMIGGGTATEVHPGQGGSPHVKVDWVVSDANISITYGRPFLKGRVVGESVEPMGDGVWRLGADEATTLVTDKDLMLRDSHIPAGEYTLWTAHMNDEFHLIVNSETGQWGTNYDSSHDVAHIMMDVDELSPPADQLTLYVTDDMFKFEWGTMTASVPLTVHE